MASDPEEEPENLDQPPPFFPYDPTQDVTRDKEDFGEPVQVRIEAVFAAQSGETTQRFVLLTDGERKLPIIIGPFEAQAISLALEGFQPDRPLTHDLTRQIIDRLGASVERVIIDDLWGTTYYAKLVIKHRGKELIIDSRPSDAIALAVRCEAPVFVAGGILDQGQI